MLPMDMAPAAVPPLAPMGILPQPGPAAAVPQLAPVAIAPQPASLLFTRPATAPRLPTQTSAGSDASARQPPQSRVAAAAAQAQAHLGQMQAPLAVTAAEVSTVPAMTLATTPDMQLTGAAGQGPAAPGGGDGAPAPQEMQAQPPTSKMMATVAAAQRPTATSRADCAPAPNVVHAPPAWSPKVGAASPTTQRCDSAANFGTPPCGPPIWSPRAGTIAGPIGEPCGRAVMPTPVVVHQPPVWTPKVVASQKVSLGEAFEGPPLWSPTAIDTAC